MKKVDYHEYLQSEAWGIRRKWKLEQAGYRCQVCNADGEMHVHHRTYERIGHERENDLTVLCKGCHAKHHGIDPDYGSISKEFVLVLDTIERMQHVGLLPAEFIDWLPTKTTSFRVSTLPDGQVAVICGNDAPIWERPERFEIARKLSAFISFEAGFQVEFFWIRREDNAALLSES